MYFPWNNLILNREMLFGACLLVVYSRCIDVRILWRGRLRLPLELAVGLHQIDDVCHHILCFLNHGQVDDAHTDASRLILDTLEFFMFQ